MGIGSSRAGTATLQSPGETCTSLSELHLAGDSQDQVRSEL